MKRSPLKRKTPLRARSPWRPVRRPLPRESAKRRRQRRVRAAVVAEVRERDGRCVAAELVPSIACRGALVVHEPSQRSVVPMFAFSCTVETGDGRIGPFASVGELLDGLAVASSATGGAS